VREVRQRLGKTQARALMAELIDLRDHLNRIIADLNADSDTPGRQVRNYDLPPEDPAIAAARWGVDPPPDDGPVPTWFAERFGAMYTIKEPTE
jgi:hypothetical protein